MSSEADDEDVQDAVDEDVEPAGPDDPEGPDLEDDDLVDVDDDMIEAASQATTSSDEDDDHEDASDREDNDDDGNKSPTETLTSGTSVGDLYCNALGMGATIARDSKGSGVDDREEQMDEYSDLARQLELDKFVDEWVEQHGAADELTPAQGIAIGTGMFAMMVLVEDPTIAENIGQEVGA
jgi:hypothetical protein